MPLSVAKYVALDLGKALQYLLKQYQDLPNHPADWGFKRDQYDKELVTYYEKHRRMTDFEE